MSEQITMENCWEYLCTAKTQRLCELEAKVYTFLSDNFLRVLRESSVYGRLTRAERELILSLRMRGKESLIVAEINDVFERVGSRESSSIASLDERCGIYYYSSDYKDWKILTKIPEEVNTKGCGICTMYNYLFLAGGIKGHGDASRVSDQVFCYNPMTDTWSEIRPLHQPRAQLKLVSIDGYLYAIGGECLFTVERYDPRMDRWSPVAPLPKGAFAVAHEATTCNGDLYVSGGSLFYRLLKYDLKRDEWQECPYNNSRKKSADMLAYKNFIFRFDVNREQGVNVFKYNAVLKMWQQCASLQQENLGAFKCALMDSCIFCVTRSQLLQFSVEEGKEHFVNGSFKAPLEARGVLHPFTLHLPNDE
ncbi:kelch repeat and BTB domain-containing protein 11-like [Xyrauchen texanus]|uniref:kelch repeat and BTB domain-containing protein 11-like n=1 Tax=Xyrauchen texanus TaxID=154827 RepID=UPI0022422FEC|nr:kelch repeat and BTB domain-containing protein 11-like [Xyrauchen texanus]